MKVAIVGGSGLVGRALTRSLTEDAHEVLVLSRDPSAKTKSVRPPARIAAWSKDDVDGLARSIDGFDFSRLRRRCAGRSAALDPPPQGDDHRQSP